MQTNYNVTSTKAAPSFGRINLHGDVPDILKAVLKPEEWKTFNEILDIKYNENQISGMTDIVDINFLGKGKKSLLARLVSNNRFVENKDASQGRFQSVMGFIIKCCKKADKMQAEVDKVKEVKVDDILKKA